MTATLSPARIRELAAVAETYRRWRVLRKLMTMLFQQKG